MALGGWWATALVILTLSALTPTPARAQVCEELATTNGYSCAAFGKGIVTTDSCGAKHVRMCPQSFYQTATSASATAGEVKCGYGVGITAAEVASGAQRYGCIRPESDNGLVAKNSYFSTSQPGVCQCANSPGVAACGGDGCGGSCGTCAASKVCSDLGEDKCTESTIAGNGLTIDLSCPPNKVITVVSAASWRGDAGICTAGDDVVACGVNADNVRNFVTNLCLGRNSCAMNSAFWAADSRLGNYCPVGILGSTLSVRYRCAPFYDPSVTPGKCVDAVPCKPSCQNKACGPDGCGGTCGTCGEHQKCGNVGQCLQCSCGSKTCGDDGCGWTCGSCPTDQVCSSSGTCQCAPQCQGKTCGPNGCGGWCGTTPGTLMKDGCSTSTCINGQWASFQYGPEVACNDANPCTNDLCMPGDLCKNMPKKNGSYPDPASPISVIQCQGGALVATTPKTCSNDNNPCTNDTLDPVTGACNSPITGLCDDGQGCTENDQCTGGLCRGTAKSCDDGNQCTVDACSEGAGGVGTCTNTPKEANSACDDGLPCTMNDVCLANADQEMVCRGVKDPCDDGNPCTIGACSVAPAAAGQPGATPQKVCTQTPTPGLACNDQNVCTKGDRCEFSAASKATVCSGQSSTCGFPATCSPSANPICQCGANQVAQPTSSGTFECCTRSCTPKASQSWAPMTPAVDHACGADGCGGTCGTNCPAGQMCTPVGYVYDDVAGWSKASGPPAKGQPWLERRECAPAPSATCSSAAGNVSGLTARACCDGRRVVRCEAGTAVVEDCAAQGLYCAATDETGASRTYACVPNRDLGDYAAAGPGSYLDLYGNWEASNPRQCPASTCIPSCTGRQCGMDGCGGFCGACGEGQSCILATGTCQANCGGLGTKRGCFTQLGPNRWAISTCNRTGGVEADVQQTLCNGSANAPSTTTVKGKTKLICGSGGANATGNTDYACTSYGACGCGYGLTKRTCGANSCGTGSCGTCQTAEVCSPFGACCTPSCAGSNCGEDGCGGSCGTCAGGQTCTSALSGGALVRQCAGPPTAGGLTCTPNETFPQCVPAAGASASQLQYCGGAENASTLTLTCPAGSACTCPKSFECRCVKPLPSCDGHCGQALDGCSCAATCVATGTCCTDFDVKCGRDVVGFRCGDQSCDAVRGETALTCPSDCNSTPSATYAGYIPERVTAVSQPHQSLDRGFSEFDDVALPPSPVPLVGLVARLAEPGVILGPPDTRGSVYNGVTNTLVGPFDDAPGTPVGVAGRGFKTGPEAILVEPHGGELVGTGAYTTRSSGGFTAAGYVRWSGKDPKQARTLGYGTFDEEHCRIGLPGQQRAAFWCDVGGAVASVEAYYGTLALDAGSPEGGVWDDCAAYRRTSRTTSCSSPDLAAAAAACVASKKADCVLNVPTIPNCAASASMRFAIRYTCSSVVGGLPAAQGLRLALGAAANDASEKAVLRVERVDGTLVARSDREVKKDEWTHVAVVYEPVEAANGSIGTVWANADRGQNGGIARLFIDGDQVAQADVLDSVSMSAWVWGGSGQKLEFDELYLYRRALEGPEIKRLRDVSVGRAPLRVWPPVDAETMVRNHYFATPGQAPPSAAVATTYVGSADFGPIWSNITQLSLPGPDRYLQQSPPMPASGPDLDNLTEWELNAWIYGSQSGDVLRVMQGGTARVVVKVAPCSFQPAFNELVARFPSGLEVRGGCLHAPSAFHWQNISIQQRSGAYVLDLDGSRVTVASSSSAPLFDAGGSAERSLEVPRLFTWAALYPGPLSNWQRSRLRRTGPTVWLNGENIEGNAAPFDYGAFANIWTFGSSYAPFGGQITGSDSWSKAFPPRAVLDKVTGGSPTFTVPLGSRLALTPPGDPPGDIRPLTVVATLTAIPYAAAESPIFTLRRGTAPYAAGRLACTLETSFNSPTQVDRWLSCKVLVAVRVGATTKTFQSAPFDAFRTTNAPDGPAADTRRLRIGVSLPGTAETPRLAMGWKAVSDVKKTGSWGDKFSGDFTEARTLVPLDVSPTPLAFEAVAATGEAGSDQLYFPSKAGWTTGTGKVSNMRVYDRQESSQGLLLALGATCADLRCADAGRSCVAAHDAFVCGACLNGSAEVAGTCVDRKPYFAACRFGRDAECGDGLVCRAGRCVYADKTSDCDAECLRKGALCVARDKAAWSITDPAASPGGYACTVEPGWVTPVGAPSKPVQCAANHEWTINDTSAAKAGAVVADQAGGSAPLGRCEWRPPKGDGDRCTSPIECSSAGCIPVARPQYRLTGVAPSSRRFLTWRLGRSGSGETSAWQWILPSSLASSLEGKTEGDAQDVTNPIGADVSLAARVPSPQFAVTLSPVTSTAPVSDPQVGECAASVVSGAEAAAKALCKARNMSAVRRAAQVFDRLTGRIRSEDRWVCEGCLEDKVNVAPTGQPESLQRLYRPAWSLLSPDACKTILTNYANYRFGQKLAEEKTKNDPRTNYPPTAVPLPQPRVKRREDGQGLEFHTDDQADWTLLPTLWRRTVYTPFVCNKIFGFIPTSDCSGGQPDHDVDEPYYPLRAIKIGATDYLYGVPDQDLLGLAASWALKNPNPDATTFNGAALSETDFVTYVNQVKARWTTDLGNVTRRGDILDAPITIGTLRALLRSSQDDPEPGAHPQPFDYAKLSSLGVGPALIRMASAGVRGDPVDQGLGNSVLDVGIPFDATKKEWLFGDLRQRSVLGACSVPTFAIRHYLPRRGWTDPSGRHSPVNGGLTYEGLLTAGVNWGVLWGKKAYDPSVSMEVNAEGTPGVDYQDATASSPFFDPEVNRSICIPNQFPDGSVCPPSSMTPHRETDGEWCLSGFCNPATKRCEEGQSYIEDRSGDDRSNRPSGGEPGWAADLTQQKGSYFRLDDVTKAPRLNAVTNKDLWKLVTFAKLTNPKFSGDKRSYELNMFTRAAFSLLNMLQITLVDANVFLQAVPGLPDGATGRVERVTSLDILDLKLTDHLASVQDGIDKAQKGTESLKEKLFGGLPGCKAGAVTWKNGEWDNQAACTLNRKAVSIKPKVNPKGLDPKAKPPENYVDGSKNRDKDQKGLGGKFGAPASITDPISTTVTRLNVPLPLGKCDVDPPDVLPNVVAFPKGELELPVLPIKLTGMPGARLCYTVNPFLSQPSAFVELSAEPSLGINYGGDLDQKTLEPAMRVGYEVGILITAKAYVKVAAKKAGITKVEVPVDDLPEAPLVEKEEKTEKKVIEIKVGLKVAIDLFTFTHDFLYGIGMNQQPSFKDLWRTYQGRGTELGMRFLKLSLTAFIEVKVWKLGIELAYKFMDFAGIRIVLPGGTFEKDGKEWLVDFLYEPPPIPKDALSTLKKKGGGPP